MSFLLLSAPCYGLYLAHWSQAVSLWWHQDCSLHFTWAWRQPDKINKYNRWKWPRNQRWREIGREGKIAFPEVSSTLNRSVWVVCFTFFLFSGGRMVFVDQKSRSWKNGVLRMRGLNLSLQKDVLDVTVCFTRCWDVSLLYCSPSDLYKSAV